MDKSRILLLRRFNTGFEDGNYSVIAGHFDGGETATEAMIREAKEEAGITIKPEHLHVVHMMHRKCPSVERIDFFFTAGAWEGTPINKEPGKCDELRWCEKNALPKNIIPYVKQAIECFQKNILYSEFGW